MGHRPGRRRQMEGQPDPHGYSRPAPPTRRPTTGSAHRYVTGCWDVAHWSRGMEPLPDALHHPQQPLRMTTAQRAPSRPARRPSRAAAEDLDLDRGFTVSVTCRRKACQRGRQACGRHWRMMRRRSPRADRGAIRIGRRPRTGPTRLGRPLVGETRGRRNEWANRPPDPSPCSTPAPGPCPQVP